MAFDFDIETSIGKVRALIGDTVESRAEFDNEVIDWFLSESGSDVYGAAELALHGLITKYAREATMQVGDLKIENGKIAESYRSALKVLKAKAGLTSTLHVGGVSITEKESEEDRTDRVNPSFSRGQFDHPGALGDDVRQDTLYDRDD